MEYKEKKYVIYNKNYEILNHVNEMYKVNTIEVYLTREENNNVKWITNLPKLKKLVIEYGFDLKCGYNTLNHLPNSLKTIEYKKIPSNINTIDYLPSSLQKIDLYDGDIKKVENLPNSLNNINFRKQKITTLKLPYNLARINISDRNLKKIKLTPFLSNYNLTHIKKYSYNESNKDVTVYFVTN